MQGLAVIVRLREGARERAAELLAQGPPFALADGEFDRHAVYLSEREVVFVFEGPEAEWRLDDLTSDVFHPALQDALEDWRPLVEGDPRIARMAYFWERGAAPGGT